MAHSGPSYSINQWHRHTVNVMLREALAPVPRSQPEATPSAAGLTRATPKIPRWMPRRPGFGVVGQFESGLARLPGYRTGWYAGSMSPVLDFPNTRSGDAIRALVATVVVVLVSVVENVVTGWLPWPAVAFSAMLYGLGMFGYARWLHRPKASVQRTPSAA
jgi:hypothetical protein